MISIQQMIFFAEQETWATDIRRDFFGLNPVIIDFSKIWSEERIIKGTMVVRSVEEKARVGDFPRHFRGSLNFSRTKTPAYPDIDFINVLVAEVSKGKALEVLVARLGISLNEVVAIGDGDNDISLLTSSGLAIAMGNASDGLKAVADYVTFDVDHSGVAAAIEKFLL